MGYVFYSYIKEIVAPFRERDAYPSGCLDAVEYAIGVFTHHINAEEFIRFAMQDKRTKELMYSVHSLNSYGSLNNGVSALKKLAEHHPEAVEAGIKVLDAIPNRSEIERRLNKKLGYPNPIDHICGRNTFKLLATHSADEIKSVIRIMEQALEELLRK